MAGTDDEGTPPGWYRQHDDPSTLRWWDGRAWTDDTMAAPADGGPVPDRPTRRSSVVTLAADEDLGAGTPEGDEAWSQFAAEAEATERVERSTVRRPRAQGRPPAADPEAGHDTPAEPTTSTRRSTGRVRSGATTPARGRPRGAARTAAQGDHVVPGGGADLEPAPDPADELARGGPGVGRRTGPREPGGANAGRGAGLGPGVGERAPGRRRVAAGEDPGELRPRRDPPAPGPGLPKAGEVATDGLLAVPAREPRARRAGDDGTPWDPRPARREVGGAASATVEASWRSTQPGEARHGVRPGGTGPRTPGRTVAPPRGPQRMEARGPRQTDPRAAQRLPGPAPQRMAGRTPGGGPGAADRGRGAPAPGARMVRRGPSGPGPGLRIAIRAALIAAVAGVLYVGYVQLRDAAPPDARTVSEDPRPVPDEDVLPVAEAVLTLEDLPAGWVAQAHDPGVDDVCKGRIPRAVIVPDDVASAAFTQSASGPFLTTVVARFADEETARAFLDLTERVMESCREYETDGATVRLGPLDYPRFGDDTFAAAATGDSSFGPISGRSVHVRVGSLVASVETIAFGDGRVSDELVEHLANLLSKRLRAL